MSDLALASALDAVVNAACERTGTNPSVLDFHWAYFDLSEEGHTEPLIERLRQMPRLGDFEGYARSVGSSAQGLSIDSLAEWIAVRALKHGTAQALQELFAYSEATAFRVQIIMALAQVFVDEPCELAPGFRLVPYTEREFDNFGDLDEEIEHTPRFDPSSPTRFITAALVADITHAKIHTAGDPRIAEESRQLHTQIRRKLDQVRLCLGLVRPSEVWAVGELIRVADSVPCSREAGSASSIVDSRHPSAHARLTRKDCTHATEIVNHFWSMSMDAQAALTVPMERLQRALRHPRATVDGAIDIGIALEALLLTDSEQDELTLRISLRGARLLGATAAERQRLSAIFTGLYRLRSTAVHRGILPRSAKPKDLSVNELFSAGRNLTAQAIVEVIRRRGVSNWDEIVFA